ncbi:MAG: replicative DNA helicase [Bacteroidetes bacterium]|nr:replicative DNA helicase [Bacteroidota bacterium]
MNERTSNKSTVKKSKLTSEYITPLDTMGRKVPSAVDMEQAVLGALLLDGTSMLRIQEILLPDYFYDEKNLYVFNAIRSLVEKNEPVDLLTVIEKLRAQEKLEFVGGEFYVSELTMKVTSSANIEYHAHIILEKYVQREMIRICGETIRDAYEASTDAFVLLDDTEKRIYEIKNQGMKRNYEGIDNLVAKALTQIEANTKHTSDVTGVPSGIVSVDRITSGWQKSDLIIIAGRPGMGKTAFALTMLRNAAVAHNVPVAFFSLEMSAVQLVTRMISAEAEISSEDLRRGNLVEHQWQQLVTKTQALSKAPIFIDDTPSLSVFELKAKARRLHSQHNIGLLMVDYLQLMKGDEVKESKMNREQEISYISRSLKTLAKELNIPVIALAQLSRETEKRADKMPQLSDLRESGSIEQDADMVAFIYRDDYYNKGEEDMSNAVGVTSKLIIKKHRNGSIGDANMFFSKRLQRFVDESESMISNIIVPSKMNSHEDDEQTSFIDATRNKEHVFNSENISPFENPSESDTEANFFDN